MRFRKTAFRFGVYLVGTPEQEAAVEAQLEQFPKFGLTKKAAEEMKAAVKRISDCPVFVEEGGVG